MHGKTSPVFHTDTGILKGLDSPFNAARYHSLVIEDTTFPEDELEITAWTEDKTIMAVQHKEMTHIQVTNDSYFNFPLLLSLAIGTDSWASSLSLSFRVCNFIPRVSLLTTA